jgi:quercetin dioxygenase-like cupin family protein
VRVPNTLQDVFSSRRTARDFLDTNIRADQAESCVSPLSPALRTVRVKTPHGEKLMPHKHPEDRVYTVISGVFYIGLGDEFDASKLEAYPPGAVIILPGNTPHFRWAKSREYVTQVTAMGPLGLEYLSAKDDPRNSNS